MKSIKKGLLLFLLIIALTVIGGTTFGWLGGIVGFLASVVILIVANRATVGFMVGQIKYNRGNHQGAYKLMKKAYDTTKLAPKLTLMYAYMMIRDGMLQEAEVVLNKVTYLNRRDLTKEDLMTADINKSIIMWKQDDISGAIELLEGLYQNNMKSTILYGTLGYFYILDNRISKALDFNKEAYEYNSDNMVIADNLAYNYIMNGELEKAEELYIKLFGQEPNFIEPYYNYATLLEKRLQYDDALTYYQKALEYPEKYLSIITHQDVYDAIERLGGTVEKQDDAESQEIADNVAEHDMPAGAEVYEEAMSDIEEQEIPAETELDTELELEKTEEDAQ